MAMIDSALEYANRGWPVFRIACQRKTPLDKWVNGPTYATTDAEEIRRRWTQNKFSNVGVATGHENERGYLWVLDVDHKNGGEVPDWAPATYTATTPGGLHLYYYSDKPESNSVGKLGRGLDVRGRGGMVVAPPSVVGGKPYVVQNLVEPVFKPVPPFYIPLNEGTSPYAYATGTSPSPPAERKNPADVLAGERNDQLKLWARYLVDEVIDPDAPDEVLPALQTVNSMMSVPLTAREVRNIANWFVAKNDWSGLDG